MRIGMENSIYSMAFGQRDFPERELIVEDEVYNAPVLMYSVAMVEHIIHPAAHAPCLNRLTDRRPPYSWQQAGQRKLTKCVIL